MVLWGKQWLTKENIFYLNSLALRTECYYVLLWQHLLGLSTLKRLFGNTTTKVLIWSGMGKTPGKWHFIIYEGWLLLHSSWRKMLLQRKWSFVRVIESTITLHKLFLQNQSGFPAESQISCLQGNWNRKSRLFWFCLMSSFSSQQYLQYITIIHTATAIYKCVSSEGGNYCNCWQNIHEPHP